MGILHSTPRCCLNPDNLQLDDEKLELYCHFRCQECGARQQVEAIDVQPNNKTVVEFYVPADSMGGVYFVEKTM